jgi:hypothetical protein
MTQPSHGETTQVSPLGAAPEADFFDAPPAADLPEWPPIGAYPGEPGYAAAEASTVYLPSGDETQVIGEAPVWQQPPPDGPFHARHEKPGEWRTEPPEHLSLEHSPPAEVHPGGLQDEWTEAIPPHQQPPSWEVPFDPHGTETPAAEPRARHKRPFWVAMALLLTLVIFGGGTASAYLLLRDAESGKGSPDPVTAVNRFMTAVYTQQDPATAGEAVCREARDKERLAARVDQIKGYANEYDAPSFRWNDPAVSGATDERAMVSVQLIMTTDDEKIAQQQLTFTVVRKTGWLVCDVTG